MKILPRLKLARVARGLSTAELAKRASSSSITISKAENGATIREDAAERIARVLGVPVADLEAPQVVDEHRVLFRKQSRLGKRQQDQIQAQSVEAVERWFAAGNDFDFARLEDFQKRWSPDDEFSQESAVTAACFVREFLGLDAVEPIRSVVEIVHWFHILIVVVDGAPDSFLGHSARTDQMALLAINGDSRIPGDRLRWTLAHELGHLLMHSFDELQMNPEDCEKHVDAFISELLFPAKIRAKEFAGVISANGRTDWAGMVALKEKWGISLGSLIFAAGESLDSITDERKAAMFRYRAWRGWQKAEPGDVAREPIHRFAINIA